MAFMYLHLFSDGGKIRAQIRNDGKISSLGGPHSRDSHAPFSVMRIEGFAGIECIDDRQLIDELLRRYSSKQLFDKLQFELTNLELLDILRRRFVNYDGTPRE